MFIHIKNHIVNITEIRNISNVSVGRGKCRVTIFLKNAASYDHIGLQDLTKDEAEAIMQQLAKSCLEFRAKK